MLSEKTIHIVKSTAPVLQEHGEALTRHFYKRMFEHNPEVKSFFNPANQFAGLQQRALAGAICAYAANIDNLEVLGGAVELIAQKHASLQIKPEHYPIVGQNLLASIREVLGESATDEIIDAWAEAYGFLADILIGREKQIYAENAQAPGGMDGFKKFTVLRKEVESEVITSFYLKPEDGSQIPDFKPGQYLTVRLPSPCGHTTMRNYSLSDKPGQDWLRISVKREVGSKANTPDGYVSNLLHSNIEAGSTLEVSAPYGEFFLDVNEKHDRPLVLLAAGVGITPIISMLSAALEAMPNRRIVLIHGSLNEKTHAFKRTVENLESRFPNLETHFRYSDANSMVSEGITKGFIDAAFIESVVKQRDADYYFCGPHQFMTGIYHDLLGWGIPASQVHFEFFGPKQELTKAA